MRGRLVELCAEARAYALRTGLSVDREAQRVYAWQRAGVASPPPPAGCRVVNATGERAKVYIYDYIDEWGVNAADFAAQLDQISAANIDVHINSPGGSVWDGAAIYQSLVSHPATITVHVDGIAASSASFIAQAAAPGELLISKAARMMIHDASGMVVGNAMDMRAMADVLDQISQDIAQIYADRAGGTADMWRQQMQANAGFGTWYNAAQAVDAKLADRFDDGSVSSGGGSGDEDDPSQGGKTVNSVDLRSRLVRARHTATLGGVRK